MSFLGTRGAASARGFGFSIGSTAVRGQQEYTLNGQYSWVAPAGVTSVCVVCVGAGVYGRGGGLGWKNDISVTPGSSYTVTVAWYAQDPSQTFGKSSFINATTVAGYNSGTNDGGTYVGTGGGNGGGWSNTLGSGGGGAGGYTGNGGNGGNEGNGSAGAGGGGGGGYGSSADFSGGGGGVGLLGQGSNGSAGNSSSRGGGGGSGGTSGGQGNASAGGSGGLYGGANSLNKDGSFGSFANGAVRIIWGAGRSFPSTNTGNV